jgi:hypothetical protein
LADASPRHPTFLDKVLATFITRNMELEELLVKDKL